MEFFQCYIANNPQGILGTPFHGDPTVYNQECQYEFEIYVFNLVVNTKLPAILSHRRSSSLKSTAAVLEMLIIMNTCHATYGNISWMLRASHQSELNLYMFAYQIQSLRSYLLEKNGFCFFFVFLAFNLQ